MKAVESQLWKLLIVCVVIVYFLAYTMLEDTIKMSHRRADEDSLGQNPILLELQPNLAELKIETQLQLLKFVPFKLLQKFRQRHGGIKFSSTDMERKRRIPIRPPSVALVCAELSRSPSNLLLISVAKGLQALGYNLELYSLEDGPVRGVWEKMETTVNIMQSNSHQPVTVDWLNYDGVVVSSLEAKHVISSLMQEPFRMVPVIWVIHENTLGMRLRLYSSNEHGKIISHWKSVFARADVVVFADYTMPMMDSGNFFVIPGSSMETWEAEHFMAIHTREDPESKLSFKSHDSVIVIVGRFQLISLYIRSLCEVLLGCFGV